MQSMKNSSLIVRNFSRIAEHAVHFANRQAPISLVYSYVVGLRLVYALAMVHTPMVVIPEFVHDDGLFMSLESVP